MPPHDHQTPKGWIDWNGEQAKKRAAEESRLRSRKPLFGTEEGRNSRLLTGVITAVAGVPSIMIGLGLWTTNSIVMAAPLTIILCMGLLFVGGGLSFALGFVSPELDEDGVLPASAPEAIRALQFFLSALAAAGLAGIGTWAVFSGKEHSIAHVFMMVFTFADATAMETRLHMWLLVLSSLLWIFALVGIVRGLWRLYQDDDTEKSKRG